MAAVRGAHASRVSAWASRPSHRIRSRRDAESSTRDVCVPRTRNCTREYGVAIGRVRPKEGRHSCLPCARKCGQECPRSGRSGRAGRSARAPGPPPNQAEARPPRRASFGVLDPPERKAPPLVGGGAWTENTTCGCQPTQGGHARLKVERDGQEIRPGIVDAILGGRTIGLKDNRPEATTFRNIANVELELRADVFSQQTRADRI